MSYVYSNGDGLAALSASTPNGATEPVSVLDDAIRQIKAYLLDPIAGPKALIDALSASITPAGTVRLTAVNTLPSGWLACDGSAVSRTTYASLFSAIGVTYGAGDSVTTFNLPDLRGRTAVGIGTGDATGATAWSLGQKKGAETHVLTDSEIPEHEHLMFANVVAGGSTAVTADEYVCRARTGGGDFDYSLIKTTTEPTLGKSGPVGSDGSHNNVQPSLGLRYIIKT